MATQDLQSKINRAVAALLVANFNTTGSTWLNTYPEPSSATRLTTSTTVSAKDGMEDGVNTGNFRFPEVSVILQDEAVAQPGTPAAADPEYLKMAASARFTAIRNLLTFSDDNGATLDFTARLLTAAGRALATGPKAADNQDMLDFTIQGWWQSGFSPAEKINGGNVTFWGRGMDFECVACNANVS